MTESIIQPDSFPKDFCMFDIIVDFCMFDLIYIYLNTSSVSL